MADNNKNQSNQRGDNQENNRSNEDNSIGNQQETTQTGAQNNGGEHRDQTKDVFTEDLRKSGSRSSSNNKED